MKQLKRLTFGALVSLIFCAIPLLAQTPAEIVTQWATLSGNEGGKVAFGRNNAVWVLDLESGIKSQIASFPLYNSQYGLIASYKFSPNGTRLAVQNNQQLIVMNADGSNQQIIWQGSINWDLISHCWDTDSAVVYSTYSRIVKTRIHENNVAGTTTILATKLKTDTLIEKNIKVDTIAIGYASVDKSGNFLGFVDIAGNTSTGGYHRPRVRNLATGKTIDLVNRNSDGCTVRLRPDSSGVSMFNYGTHTSPAPIVDTNPYQYGSIAYKIIDQIAPVNNLGICGMRWSNKSDYIVHNGDRSVSVGGGRTSVAYSWIRKISSEDTVIDYVFLGDTMYWPDLWVGKTIKGSVDLPKISPDVTSFSTTLNVSIACTTSNAEIYYTLNGVDPTTASTKYNGPFTISTTSTLKAKAFKTGMKASNIAEKRFLQGVLKTADSVVSVVPGLTYTYYEGQFTKALACTTTMILDSGSIDSFDITSRNGGNNFAFIFKGYISIPKDEVYTFYCKSDEGSLLFIGDSLVVNNDGVHTTLEKSGTIALSAGYHAIRVVYFETTGDEQLNVLYESAFIPKTGIPKSILYTGITSPKMVLVSPKNAIAYALGDTVKLCWQFKNAPNMASVVSLSLDNGKSYSYEPFSAPFSHITEQRDTFFVIPNDPSFITNAARLKIYMYGNAGLFDASPVPFQILETTPVRYRQLSNVSHERIITIGNIPISFTDPTPQLEKRVLLFDMKGEFLSERILSKVGDFKSVLKKSNGCVIIKIVSMDKKIIAIRKVFTGIQ